MPSCPLRRPALPVRCKCVWGRTIRLLAVLWCASAATAAAQTTYSVAWDANNDLSTAGYRLYGGIAPGQYAWSIDVGNATTAALPALPPGTTYYFVVRAYNASGQFGPPSNEASLDLNGRPGMPTSFVATAAGSLVTLSLVAPRGQRRHPVPGFCGHLTGRSQSRQRLVRGQCPVGKRGRPSGPVLRARSGGEPAGRRPDVVRNQLRRRRAGSTAEPDRSCHRMERHCCHAHLESQPGRHALLHRSGQRLRQQQHRGHRSRRGHTLRGRCAARNLLRARPSGQRHCCFRPVQRSRRPGPRRARTTDQPFRQWRGQYRSTCGGSRRRRARLRSATRSKLAARPAWPTWGLSKSARSPRSPPPRRPVSITSGSER